MIDCKTFLQRLEVKESMKYEYVKTMLTEINQ